MIVVASWILCSVQFIAGLYRMLLLRTEHQKLKNEGASCGVRGRHVVLCFFRRSECKSQSKIDILSKVVHCKMNMSLKSLLNPNLTWTIQNETKKVLRKLPKMSRLGRDSVQCRKCAAYWSGFHKKKQRSLGGVGCAMLV